ncbi:DNA-processing protein DprA [Hydrogenophaga defluvii]|uniref:DNA-processing protein DprA n=1 Tax=Hydrogenophaga defluvii TaxID=249410 RepID=A0ABW2SF18_9BURK
MERDELGAWLRLLLTPGVGNATARQLLAALGGPHQVFEQSPAVLASLVGPRLADALLTPPPEWVSQLSTTWAWLQAGPAHHVLSLADAGYPPDLLQMPDPPTLLFVQGSLAALAHRQRVAVVGSRNPTPQGQLNAREFARALGHAGVCVVSGLALGVDGGAHEGALDAGAPTVAVVGTGLDRVYPARHKALAHRIAATGALISEYPLGTPPLAPHFPKRNRLIAALGQGTLVVEAALQSGSLITARLAADMGRDVFAIPGSIHSPQSRGCHALIRQGAKLVESAQDVLEELHVLPPADAAAPADEPPEVPATGDAALLAALGHDPVGLDALQARTGWPTAQLQAALLELELVGEVGRLPGGLFQRVGRV